MGMTRDMLIQIRGLPTSWIGKPPCFFPEIPDPLEAEVWHYWDGAVAIRFDSDRKVDEISVFADRVVPGTHPFEDWPPGTLTQATRIVAPEDVSAVFLARIRRLDRYRHRFLCARTSGWNIHEYLYARR